MLLPVLPFTRNNFRKKSKFSIFDDGISVFHVFPTVPGHGYRRFQKDSFLMIAKMTVLGAQTELWDHPQLDTSGRAHHLRFPQLSRAPRERFRLVSEKDSFFVHYFQMKYLVLCVHSLEITKNTFFSAAGGGLA